MVKIFRGIICMSLFVMSSTFVAIASEGDNNYMTIAVFGASGKIGSMVTREALARGHRVVGISRNPDKLSGKINHEHFTVAGGDVTNTEFFAGIATGVDAIVISVQGNTAGNEPAQSTHAMAAGTAVKAMHDIENAPYVLQIGGAISMLEDEEKMLKAWPQPLEKGSAMHGMLVGHLVALNTYRASNIAWTVLTPPMSIKGWTPQGITDEKKPGNYRTSTTGHLMNSDGKSEIYIADLAAAAVDELENRSFVSQRFTVGY